MESLTHNLFKRLTSSCVFALLLGWSVMSAAAQDEPPPASPSVMYVNDIIYIAVREQPDTSAGEVRVIPSGTELEIIDRPAESEFYRIRLEDGVEGWVLHRFLVGQRIARDRLAEVEAMLVQFQSDNTSHQSILTQLQTEKRRLDKKATTLQKENEKLRKDLTEVQEISADALKIFAEGQRLKKEYDTQVEALAKLKESYDEAQELVYIVAFTVAVIGIGLGFYIGNTPTRREKNWRKVP